jgi:hypothetical protein
MTMTRSSTLTERKGRAMSEWIQATAWLARYEEARMRQLPKRLQDRPSLLEGSPEDAIVNMVSPRTEP